MLSHMPFGHFGPRPSFVAAKWIALDPESPPDALVSVDLLEPVLMLAVKAVVWAGEANGEIVRVDPASGCRYH